MPRLEYHTAGESHGPAMVVVVSGMPAGLRVDAPFINAELSRRQGGYGRGARQHIEDDRVEFLAGLRRNETIGSPIVMKVTNKDERLDDAQRTPPVTRPRPGHADLAGSLKYLTTDCRGTLERASARETAARVAAGALSRLLLRELEIEAFGFVRAIGGVATTATVTEINWHAARSARDASETLCPDPAASEKQKAVIREAKIAKDTVGGVVEAHVFGVPPGLGSCMDWRDKLDARLAYAVMSVQAIKGVEIGLGFAAAARAGSLVHDAIHFDASKRETPCLGFTRDSNNAGGTEGGMSNAQPIVVRAAMKPISTLLRGMPSVELSTREHATSQHERSDICAVPAASVVVENVAAFEVARALRDKFAGDSMIELRDAYQRYLELARTLPLDPPVMRLA